MARRNIGSGYPFEDAYGYSRAVRCGNQVFVSGTTARGPALDRDVYGQAESILGLIREALAEAGAEMRHVVRTVVYVADMADRDEVARVHQNVFGQIRPASTLVQVTAFTLPQARIEIEVTAIVAD